ncbi:MAG TPA: hypothetical protein VIJ96_15080 [Acidothermaceae bacterium]
MSKTLLNRLALFEVLDVLGPLSVTELARRSGLDLTVISRTVAACEPAGWLTRIDGKVAIGPRCTLLGHNGPTADVIARAAALVHAVAGVTGLLTHAYALIGTESVLIAAAAGREPAVPASLAVRAPLHATAGGRAIAAQLHPERLHAVLPKEPFPGASAIIATMTGTSAAALFTSPTVETAAGYPGRLPQTHAELEIELAKIRAGGLAVDRGDLDPAISCLAKPWPQHALPAAIGCLGTRDALDTDAPLIQHALAAATTPGATARDIIASAATE